MPLSHVLVPAGLLAKCLLSVHLSRIQLTRAQTGCLMSQWHSYSVMQELPNSKQRRTPHLLSRMAQYQIYDGVSSYTWLKQGQLSKTWQDLVLQQDVLNKSCQGQYVHFNTFHITTDLDGLAFKRHLRSAPGSIPDLLQQPSVESLPLPFAGSVTYPSALPEPV